MKKVELGLKENWRQFTLLVIINAFVGGMIGLERTILPEIADVDFGMAAKTAILSYHGLWISKSDYQLLYGSSSQ